MRQQKFPLSSRSLIDALSHRLYGCSADWLHRPYKPGVAGSSPVPPKPHSRLPADFTPQITSRPVSRIWPDFDRSCRRKTSRQVPVKFTLTKRPCFLVLNARHQTPIFGTTAARLESHGFGSRIVPVMWIPASRIPQRSKGKEVVDCG